ncbi:MAG: integrase [Pseudomonadota bacterium]
MYSRNLPAIIEKKRAWNKGHIVGQKRPLLPKHVWAVRVRLELAGSTRDLGLFNMAVDSKPRGCDLDRLKVADVYSAGRIQERTSVLQSKTSKPVQFEMTECTRKSLAEWIDHPTMIASEHLWPGRFHEPDRISTRQYERLVKEWVTLIGLEDALDLSKGIEI